MVKKWEVRILKQEPSKMGANVPWTQHSTHYFDLELEANDFFDNWKPSTRLPKYRLQLICVTESVEKIRETKPLNRTKLPKL